MQNRKLRVNFFAKTFQKLTQDEYFGFPLRLVIIYWLCSYTNFILILNSDRT